MHKKVIARRASSWLDHSPTQLLHRVTQCAGDIFRAHIEDGELTPRQVAVLTAVAENASLNHTDIVGRTGIDRSTLTGVMRRLTRKGLLQRGRTKEDARAYTVTLTDAGSRALRTAMPLAEKVDRQILAPLSPKDRAAFVSLLQTVIATLPSRRVTD